MSPRPGRGSPAGARSGPVPLRGPEYVVVDVETTGGPARRGHRVTEIAAVCVDADGRALDEFCSLVNPDRPIPPFITRLTGISDAMVHRAPGFDAVAGQVRALLDGRVFVAHNVSFDWRFVRMEMTRAGEPWREDAPRLCTVRLARRLVPEVDRRSLDVLCEHFGIRNAERHRALGDARATAELFALLVDRLEARGIRYWHQLEAFLARHGHRTVEQPTFWDDPEEARWQRT